MEQSQTAGEAALQYLQNSRPLSGGEENQILDAFEAGWKAREEQPVGGSVTMAAEKYRQEHADHIHEHVTDKAFLAGAAWTQAAQPQSQIQLTRYTLHPMWSALSLEEIDLSCFSPIYLTPKMIDWFDCIIFVDTNGDIKQFKTRYGEPTIIRSSPK